MIKIYISIILFGILALLTILENELKLTDNGVLVSLIGIAVILALIAGVYL